MVIAHYVGFNSSSRSRLAKRPADNQQIFLFGRHCKQFGCDYILVFKDTPYLGGGQFEHYYRLLNGRGYFRRVNQPVTVDLIFNRGNLPRQPQPPQLINSAELFAIGANKIQQAKLFSDLMPPTFIAHSHAQALNFLRSQPTQRWLIKPTKPSGSRAIQFIDRPDDLVVDDRHRPPFVIQAFVETKLGAPHLANGRHDLRVWFLNDQPLVMAIRQSANDALLANTTSGGQIRHYLAADIPASLFETCRAVNDRLKHTGHRFYSADFVRDEQGHWWLIAINPRPKIPASSANPNLLAIQRRIAFFLVRLAGLARAADKELYHHFKQTRQMTRERRQVVWHQPAKTFVITGADQPAIDQDKLRLADFQKQINKLSRLAPREIQLPLRQTYRAFVQQSLASRELLASRRSLQTSFQAAKFKRANLKLYGELDISLWQASINSLLGRHHQAGNWRERLGVAAHRTVELPQLKSTKLMTLTKGLRLEELRAMLADAPGSNSAKLRHLLINFLSLPAWRVTTDPHQRHSQLAYSQKCLVVPRNIDKRSALKLQRLAIHEIGIHLQRHQFAKLMPIRAFNFGLPGYRRFEEGLAVLLTSQLTGQQQPKGVIAYAALGLALGLDGQARNHHQTQEILTELLALGAVTKKADLTASKLCRRLFAGVDPKAAGAVHLKPKLYLEGTLLAANLLNSCSSQTELLRLMQYRYNPSADYQRLLVDWLVANQSALKEQL